MKCEKCKQPLKPRLAERARRMSERLLELANMAEDNCPPSTANDWSVLTSYLLELWEEIEPIASEIEIDLHNQERKKARR